MSSKTIVENQVVVLSLEQLRGLLEETVEKTVEKVCGSLPQPVKEEPQKWPTDEERYLTRRQASEMFHVNATTLWRWEKDGFPAFKAGERRVLYKLSDLLTMVKQKGKHNKRGFTEESITPVERAGDGLDREGNNETIKFEKPCVKRAVNQ